MNFFFFSNRIEYSNRFFILSPPRLCHSCRVWSSVTPSKIYNLRIENGFMMNPLFRRTMVRKCPETTHKGKKVTRPLAPLAPLRSILLLSAPLHSTPLRCAPFRSASLAGSFASGKVATYEREPYGSILDSFAPQCINSTFFSNLSFVF